MDSEMELHALKLVSTLFHSDRITDEERDELLELIFTEDSILCFLLSH